MISIALALSLLTPLSYAASLVAPTDGVKSCFAREYSVEHMKRNPRQHFSKMHVLLSEDKMQSEGQTYSLQMVRVVGEKHGQLWGNKAGCEYAADGSATCSIECDGGSFQLKPQSGKNIHFQISKDYYFPFIRAGAKPVQEDGEPDQVAPEDMLSLEYKDRDNRTYRLEQSEPGLCETVWDRYLNVPDYGC